jgi:hypothetical protein
VISIGWPMLLTRCVTLDAPTGFIGSRQGGEPVLAPELPAVRPAPKPLIAFFRWRPIMLARNNLTMRIARQLEADCGLGISR